ncbi:MAG: hypothetical protein ACFHVJ_03790 [Aestuariibacter sp.]
MVVASVSIILFTVLLLVYFVVKNQAMQRELREFKYQARSAQKTARFTLTTIDSLAQQVQKILLAQLDSAHKRGLVKGDDHAKIKAIFNGFESVIMSCCEHGSTVDEAINRALKSSEFDADAIKQFISGMPSEVRLAWVKNQVGSYVVACTNINNVIMNPTSSTPTEEKQTG